MAYLDTEIRQPAVAGLFYPGEATELAETLDRLLQDTQHIAIAEPLVALISPHAGYPFSGHVAAEAYSLLRGRDIERVVVISPCHVEAFPGASVYSGEGYATPLGVIPVDKAFCEKLASKSKRLEYSNRGHRNGPEGRGEHALEVQLPFLQRVLDEFEIVPIVMGDQRFTTCKALAQGLGDLIDGPETLVVASSDLSHFHRYDAAVQMDRKVLHAIERWDYLALSRNLDARVWEACGGGPIITTMLFAEHLGATEARILKYANSGDIPGGDKERVVGYGAVSFSGDKNDNEVRMNSIDLSKEEREQLLSISREAVKEAAGGRELKWNSSGASEALLTESAVFVTLKKHGQLRGCVGSIVPVESLGAAVATAAANAALRDTRFQPVSPSELDQLEYEISVLSPFRRVSEPRQIKVGLHGLLIERGRIQGLLLPQVATERNWDRETFLEQTCLKAGLSPNAWKDDETNVYVFSATVFGENK